MSSDRSLHDLQCSTSGPTNRKGIGRSGQEGGAHGNAIASSSRRATQDDANAGPISHGQSRLLSKQTNSSRTKEQFNSTPVPSSRWPHHDVPTPRLPTSRCYHAKCTTGCIHSDMHPYSHRKISDAISNQTGGESQPITHIVAETAGQYYKQAIGWLMTKQKSAQDWVWLAAQEAVRFLESELNAGEPEGIGRQTSVAGQGDFGIEKLPDQGGVLIEEAFAVEQARWIEEAVVTTQHIVFGSTLVTCGTGLEILAIVSGFDSCCLTIQNLPPNTKKEDIAEFFTQQQIGPDEYHIFSIYPMGEDLLEATVIINAEQGGRFATSLEGILFVNKRLKVILNANTPPNTMGDFSARYATTLTIFWPSPSASAIALYPSIRRARTRARVLDGKILDGREIKAETAKGPTISLHPFHALSSVKLTGLPVDTTEDYVCKWAGATSVQMAQSKTYNLRKLLGDLQQHLVLLPHIVVHSFDDQEMDGICTVKVRFRNWDEANAARVSLEDKHLRSDYPLFHFSLPQRLHFESVFSIQQYTSQRQRWNDLANSKYDERVEVQIIPLLDRDLVHIRLLGDDRNTVGAIKVRLEALIAGETLDTTYWHKTFLWPKGKIFLSRIFSETGVYVRGDFKIQALKIFGEGERRERALAMIMEEVDRLSQQDWTVTLKREAVGYFCREGLPVLKELLGEDAVSLDFITSPCKITIRGGEAARHTLSLLVDQALKYSDVRRISRSGDSTCPICYDTARGAVILQCKHTYCTACIQHYLTSAATNNLFPLLCIGDEDTCKMPITIPVIQRLLVPQQFECLVATAASAYLDRHPREFRHCSTPDCTQIYSTSTKAIQQCPSCFKEMCTSCQEAHEGTTCEERRLRKVEEDEGLNDKWAVAHGVKRCPACQVYIEKVSGCNHMTCRCGAHVCWTCLKTFPLGKIYKHLRKAHGGVNAGDVERENADLALAMAIQLDEGQIHGVGNGEHQNRRRRDGPCIIM